MQLFEELDVPRDKYLLRIPATWEGIQAAKTLEAEGAATHIIMVYRCLDGDVCWLAALEIVGEGGSHPDCCTTGT